MFRNMIKAPPWFKNQMGVPGGDTPEGFRSVSSARTFYVDNDHALTSDANDGTDPNAPLETIQAAVTKLLISNGGQRGDEIIIAPGEYSESVEIDGVTDDYALHCSIRGSGPNRYGTNWASGLATDPCLVLGVDGWSISNIRFVGPVTDFCVILSAATAPYLGEGDRAIITGCYFDGVTVGLGGIDFHGAPHGVRIEDCYFAFFQNAGQTSLAIASTTTALADAYFCKILNNHFYENDWHIDVSFNVSIIMENTFAFGGQFAATTAMLDLRGGTLGDNIVAGNIFRGDYSITGGYAANAANPGFWFGNFAEDTAEAEVNAAGQTLAIPAA